MKNIYVITIHNPGISFGPNLRLEGFLKEAETHDLKFTLPSFCRPEKHSKLQTFLLTIQSLNYVIKKRSQIDSIHVVTPPSYPGLVAVFAKKVLRLPYVVDVGDPCAENMAAIKGFSPKSLRFKFLKYIDKTVLKNANHIILSSPEIEKYIPKGIPFTTILTGLTRQEDILPHQLPKNKKCVYLGNYGPLQNLSYLIKVFAKAIKTDPEITLDIYGTGERKYLESLTKELKAEENIHFHDPVSPAKANELAKKYTLGLVSLDLNSNLDYAIPTKLLTSLAEGLPVFGTGGKATKDLIRKAEAGYISTNYDENRDTTALLNLLSNRQTLENHSKNAQNFARNNLTCKTAVKNYKLTLQ